MNGGWSGDGRMEILENFHLFRTNTLFSSLLTLSTDGVAPRAKMNQQRSRRFRSAQEAKEKEDDTAEFIKMLEHQKGAKVDDSLKNKKVWDSNAITPGTPFMDVLSISIKYWVAYKLNTDPAWAQVSHT